MQHIWALDTVEGKIFSHLLLLSPILKLILFSILHKMIHSGGTVYGEARPEAYLAET